MSKPKKGCIVILHNYLYQTTPEEAEKVLEQEYGEEYNIDCKPVEIKPYKEAIIEHKKIHEVAWKLEAAHQSRRVDEVLKPLIEQYPTYEVFYFGSAPVPLCIHLGLLLGNWTRVRVLFKHHSGDREWYFSIPTKEAIPMEEPAFKLKKKGLPRDDSESNGDVLIMVETSYQGSKEEFKDSISEEVNLDKTIRLVYEPRQLDLPDVHFADEISSAFADALNRITNHLKNIQTIHLLALTPTGIAFLLGNQLSANVHDRIQTYQYDARGDVKYLAALQIGGEEKHDIELSDEALKEVKPLKEQYYKQWHKMKRLITTSRKSKKHNESWYQFLLPEESNTTRLAVDFWKNLPHLADTPLEEAQFDIEAEAEGDFGLTRDASKWMVSDNLVHAIYQRLKQVKDAPHRTQQALRLLLFHEVMHEDQGMMGGLSNTIGQFPKILETTDYQADVWAMLHEYYYAETHYSDKMGEQYPKNPSQFFVQLIDSAINTMWAFNDDDQTLQTIPIYRFNRYLIWYWQRARIEHRTCKNLNDVLTILTELPIVEIKGLEPKIEQQRILYRLHKQKVTNSDLEIGVLWKNKVKRVAERGNFKISSLLKAFRERNHKGIIDQIDRLHRILKEG